MINSEIVFPKRLVIPIVRRGKEMYEDSDELEELMGSDEDEQARDELENGLRLFSNDTVVECERCGANIIVPGLFVGSFQCPYCFGVVLI
jgi:hypothetical protein